METISIQTWLWDTYFVTKNIPYKNILKLLVVAVAERFFPYLATFGLSKNPKWLTFESLTKCNFEMRCSEFKTFLSNRPNTYNKK